jgi:hypothetical protein
MSTNYRLCAALLAFAAAQVSAAPLAAASTATAKAPAPPTNSACETRNNDTTVKLLQCIRKDPLWKHMVAFQNIANANPGPDGHPSRNIGEPGYLASAQYVAAKMSAAGYRVQLQEYTVPYFNYTAMAYFDKVTPTSSTYALRTDWNPATYSGSGNVTATVQPVGGILIPAPSTPTNHSGCSAGDFAGFTPGNIALIQRGYCGYWTKVHNAEVAGAVGVIIFNEGSYGRTGALRGFLSAYDPVSIPVAMASYAIGVGFYTQYNNAQNPAAHIDVQTIHDPYRADYNVIADSPLGDPNLVVVEGHLDAIYGAGMLDSASGSATILETGLKMSHTKTRNQLRYVWFGGEELGLYGSWNYVSTLSPEEVSKIVFDIDSDVTATPNYTTAIADPANSGNAPDFPPGLVEASQRGNNYFREYFINNNLPYVDWSNDGTDSWSFSWFGVPNTGILTGQDCCKEQYEVDLFGGSLGNYEGNLNSYDGGFVDRPFLWGDNLSNNDPYVLEATSKAFAYVTWKLANDDTLATLKAGLAKSAAPAKAAARPVPTKRSPIGEDR